MSDQEGQGVGIEALKQKITELEARVKELEAENKQLKEENTKLKQSLEKETVLWTAEVSDGLVAEWRIYSDIEEKTT